MPRLHPAALACRLACLLLLTAATLLHLALAGHGIPANTPIP